MRCRLMHMRNLVQQHERNVVNLYTPNLGNRCADVASLGDEVLVSFWSFDKVTAVRKVRSPPSGNLDNGSIQRPPSCALGCVELRR